MKSLIQIGLIALSAVGAAQTRVAVQAPQILGVIPDGTIHESPTAPAPFTIRKRHLLNSKTHEQGGRTVTIQQIKPVLHPSFPLSKALANQSLDQQDTVDPTTLNASDSTHELLFLGATVYRFKNSPPRTLVRWWPEGSGTCFTFWSSADFALIAGGIQSFTDAGGYSHSLVIAWSTEDVEDFSELQTIQWQQDHGSKLPNFPLGEATFRCVEAQPCAEDLGPIEILHELYNRNLRELKTAYAGRERTRLANEAFLKANPPQAKDITIDYWRTERPAILSKGGGR